MKHVPKIAVPRSPRVAVGIAVSALIAVLIMLAGFNVLEARHAVTDIREIRRLHDVNDAFQSASVNLANADAVKAILLTQPSPELLGNWTQDVSAYAKALEAVNQMGDAPTRSMASSIETNLAPILAIEQSILSIVVAQDRTDGLEYFQTSVAAAERDLPQSPPLNGMAYQSVNGFDNASKADWSGLLNEASRQESADTMAALDGLQGEQERNATIIAILNAAGLLLAGLLLASAHRFGRRSALEQAELELLRRAVLTDALTRLGNRRAFEEVSEAAYRQASRAVLTRGSFASAETNSPSFFPG